MKKRIILAMIIGAILAGLSLFYETGSYAPGYSGGAGICNGMNLDSCSPSANQIKHRGFPFQMTSNSPAYASISNSTKAMNAVYMALDVIFFAAIAYLIILLFNQMKISKGKKSTRPAKK